MRRFVMSAVLLAAAVLLQLTAINGLRLPGGGVPDLVLVVVAALGLVVGPAPFGGTATLTSPPTVSASQWTNAHAPSASGSNLLNDVSCTTASFCVAVGQQNSGAGGGTLVEQWNGSSWAVVPSVNVPATSDDNLVSVSCVGPSFCMAVGSFTSTSATT